MLLLAFLAALRLAASAADVASQAWVELGDKGQMIARAITTGSACPAMKIDGAMKKMKVRVSAQPPKFPIQVCERKLPASAKKAEVETASGWTELPLKRDKIRRIAIIGDTGCRIQAPFVQSCNDTNAWPAEKISKAAASMQPDLVIHLGDYLYRETECPAANQGCKGSPHGVGFDVWNVDFFQPQKALLGAAPWVFVRGNHEDCQRGAEGWFRLLDTQPYKAACTEFGKPMVVKADPLSLFVVDTSRSGEIESNPIEVAVYTKQFRKLRKMKAPAWILLHRPIWAWNQGRYIDATLRNSIQGELPPSVEMIISGHVHAFEALSFGGARTPQMLVGNSGTSLYTVDNPPIGKPFQGTTLTSATILSEFGFVIADLQESTFTLYSPDAAKLASCKLLKGDLKCE